MLGFYQDHIKQSSWGDKLVEDYIYNPHSALLNIKLIGFIYLSPCYP